MVIWEIEGDIIFVKILFGVIVWEVKDLGNRDN